MAKVPEVFSLVAKHQFVIHLDYDPTNAGLEIHYSYPLTALHVAPERVIRIPRDQILRDILRHVDHLVRALTVRIPSSSGPSQDRACRPTGATIVLQDERHGRELPVAWLNYEEEGQEFGSRAPKKLRMALEDFGPDELSSWDRLRQRVKGIVWTHFQGAVADLSP